MPFPLTSEQKIAVEERGGPVLVSAAAGAGKTRVLVERLLAQVSAGADVDDFLVITFTNAAAAELRGRVLEEVNLRLAQSPGDRHLRRQTALVYQAHISTVHAFCGDFLRRWGHVLDLDPDFRLAEQGEADVLQAEAVTQLLEECYQSPTQEFSLVLDTFSPGRDDWALSQMILEIYRKLQGHPDPEEWLERQKASFATDAVTDAAQTLWGAYLLQKWRDTAAYWLEELTPVFEECREGVPMYLDSLSVTLAGLEKLAGARSWEDARPPEFPRLSPATKAPDKALAEQTKVLRERCKSRFAQGADQLGVSSAALLRDLEDVAPAAQGLLELVGGFSRMYRQVKTRRNVLDFNDLEHLTLEILRREPDAAAQCAGEFAEVMVDEYQDTNQVQNAIFDLLTRETGNLFMVGDVKQSIYRFRLADPAIFQEKYQTYPSVTNAVPGEGRRVVLSTNFRSGPEVIDAVNFLFGNLMSRRLGELDYGADEWLFPREGVEPRAENRTELWVVSNPAAEEDGDNSMVEPRLVAGRLRALLDSGFTVPDGDARRPLKASDIAILLRAPSRVLSRYTWALTEQGIPWASEGGEDFFDAPEVSVALSYLDIIDNPRQDVPLIAVLRSPLYGFSPDRLASLSARRGDGCYYDALLADGGEDAARVLDDLHALRLVAQDKRSYELLWEVYCRTGLLALYSGMEGGDRRREHLLSLYTCARQYVQGGHKGVFGFLTHLRRRREQGEILSAPAEVGDGVRILSIHRSKGLEFPVVVAAGLGRQFNRQDSYAPMLFHRELGLGPQGLDTERRIRYPTLARWAVAAKLDEEMRGEELRLLYVALTRAREKLILTTAMKNPERELDKLVGQAALPVAPEALNAMPTAAHWVLSAALCRREGAVLRGGIPPAHVPPADTFWGAEWEIHLEDGESYQKRPHVQGALTDPVETGAAPLVPPDYTWVYPWQEAANLPSKLTATQLKGREVDREVEEESAPRPRPVIFDRPAFARAVKGLTPGERGTAHHLVMQFLDFDKAADVEGVKAEIARLVSREIITPQQGEAVDPTVILAFFRSELGREAMAAGNLHREFKFSLLRPGEDYYGPAAKGEEVLLQGVVDAWYDTPEGLVIIDFKSDRVTGNTVEQRAQEYRPQLDAYAQALSALTGRPVRRRVLWFFALNQEVEI